MINIYNQDYAEYIKTIPDESVDLILTDPPWLVTKEAWDKIEVVDERFVDECKRILKPTGNLYVWCGIGEKSQSLIRWFPLFQKEFIFKDLITWKKKRGIGMRKGWLQTREECMWWVKDNNSFYWNKENQYSDEIRGKMNYNYTLKNGKSSDDYIKSEYKRLTTVWTDISEKSFDTKSKDSLINLHFTPKPMKAIERIILSCTKENDLVFDPFLGSGTTAIACKKLNRDCIGTEINPLYFELIQNRLK